MYLVNKFVYLALFVLPVSSDCKKTTPSSKGQDPALALRLWEESVKWVGLEDFDPFAPETKAAT